jgi:hypothetical protein
MPPLKKRVITGLNCPILGCTHAPFKTAQGLGAHRRNAHPQEAAMAAMRRDMCQRFTPQAGEDGMPPPPSLIESDVESLLPKVYDHITDKLAATTDLVGDAPKVDGRKQNKGAGHRHTWSVTVKKACIAMNENLCKAEP